MDISKVQKLNQLAMNLNEHNIYNKETAIKHAESLYGEEHNFSREKVRQPQNNETDKTVRKMGFALQRAVRDIAELKSTVKKLRQELNDVRVNQTYTRPEQSNTQHNVTKQESIKQEAQKQLKPKKDFNKPIDRNNVAPSDVSIERFFYFGEK